MFRKLFPGMSQVLIILGIFFLFIVPVFAGQDTNLTAQGTMYLNQGRYSDAISSFSSALAVNPNNLQARVNKGTALFSSGKSSEALLSFDIALNQDPTYVPALLERGRVLLATEDPKEALDSYNLALQQNPGNTRALEGKGDALLALGQGGEATAAWNEALSNDPGNTRLKGKIASAQGNSGVPFILWAAIAVLLVIIPSGLFLCMRSSRKGSPRGKNISTKKVSKSNNPNDKIEDNKITPSQPILLTRPGSKKGTAPVKESHLVRIHRIMNNTGRNVRLAAGDKPAGSRNPGTENDGLPGNVPRMAGTPEVRLPDIEMDESSNKNSSSDSVTDITRSLEVLLKTRECTYSGDGLKGILLYSNREYEAAVREFDKEIANYPDVICVTLLKVRALMHLKRFSEAFDTDRNVLKLAKDNYEAIVLGALLADQLGDLAFGLRACNKAISLRHNAPVIWALKGTILHKMGNYNEALYSCKQSLDLDSESDVVWKEYGDILSKVGLYPEAIDAFGKVLLLTGEDPEIRARIETCIENLNVHTYGREKVNSSRIESVEPPNPDPLSLHRDMGLERTDNELTDMKFFSAIDQQNLVDWPGTGVHEQKS